MEKPFYIDQLKPIVDAYKFNEITIGKLTELLNEISINFNTATQFHGIPTGITTRDGEMIYGGDILENVQGTVFFVGFFEEKFVLVENGSIYSFEKWMSPNLWIKERSIRKK